MARDAIDTERALILWRGAQHDSERMCVQLLVLADYCEVDPSHPLGGPDGRKDAVCQKGGKRWIMAAYFPREPVPFAKVEEKLRHDAEGIATNGAVGMVFFTNCSLTLSERDALAGIVADMGYEVDLYHLERIRILLDAPRGYGTRLEFLGIHMSEAEQVSFFALYNQTVLAKLDDVRRDIHESLALQRRQHAETQALLQKLAAGPQINLAAVLAATPATGEEPSALDEGEEQVEAHRTPAQNESDEEGGDA